METISKNEVLAELRRAEDYPLEPGVIEVLRPRIAAAVFECAERGHDDRAMLRQAVIARFWKPAGG